jgi:hypothetical protein
VADALHDLQFDQFVRQQMQRPSAAPFRRLAAGRRDQLRLSRSVQLAILPLGRGCPLQRRVESALHELLPHTMDCREAHLGELSDPLITPARGSFALVGLE